MKKTWEDLERAARDDPFLYAVVCMTENGMPREQALIWGALALSADRQRLVNENTEYLRTADPLNDGDLGAAPFEPEREVPAPSPRAPGKDTGRVTKDGGRRDDA